MGWMRGGAASTDPPDFEGWMRGGATSTEPPNFEWWMRSGPASTEPMDFEGWMRGGAASTEPSDFGRGNTSFSRLRAGGAPATGHPHNAARCGGGGCQWEGWNRGR